MNDTLIANCSTCEHPLTDNGMLCHECTGEFVDLLRYLPTLMSDLNITIAKQDNVGPRQPHTGTPVFERPLPFNTSASDALWGLGSVVSQWAHALIRGTEKNPEAHLRALSTDPITYLLVKMPEIRRKRFASAMFSEIRSAARNVVKVIDTPVASAYAGPCMRSEGDARCAGQLYAREAVTTLLCPVCGTCYDLGEHKMLMLNIAEDQEVSIAMAVRLGQFMGVDLKQSTISGWLRRGFLTPVDDGLFRFGDILNLKRRQLAQMANFPIAV